MQSIVQKWVEVLLALPVRRRCKQWSGQHVMHVQWMGARVNEKEDANEA